VPRAKRTDRAEARRRYRSSIADSLEDEELDLDPEGGPSSAAVTRPAPASTDAAVPRPSIIGAFRSSFRPIDLRGDLRALPMLLRHWSFLLPVILTGASVAAIPLFGVTSLTSAFYQYFSFTLPLGSAFLAGFFAPRASWLLGLLVALASVGFQFLAFSTGPFGGVFDKDVTGQPVERATTEALILSQALGFGVPMSGLFAAAAAWYKRFLNRASPSRQRAAAAGASNRRPDGKVPKRNEQRPILARRR
jgi:drug/metabolite transporter (DMT)-like permease